MSHTVWLLWTPENKGLTRGNTGNRLTGSPVEVNFVVPSPCALGAVRPPRQLEREAIDSSHPALGVPRTATDQHPVTGQLLQSTPGNHPVHPQGLSHLPGRAGDIDKPPAPHLVADIGQHPRLDRGEHHPPPLHPPRPPPDQRLAVGGLVHVGDHALADTLLGVLERLEHHGLVPAGRQLPHPPEGDLLPHDVVAREGPWLFAGEPHVFRGRGVLMARPHLAGEGFTPSMRSVPSVREKAATTKPLGSSGVSCFLEPDMLPKSHV